MTRAQYDNHVGDDEFHPHNRLAAFFADGNALTFARGIYTDAIKRLENIADRSAKEQNKLDDLRDLLKSVEQRIADRATTEPED